MRRSFEHSFKITQQGTTLNQIPFKSDALFWLDGTVNLDGTALVDKINGWEFPLSAAYDWDLDIVTKIIPYKTAITVSAPANGTAAATAIQAKDVNNFWYASNGVANVIPFTSFYPNIDYENKCFCKNKSQTVALITGVELTFAGVKDIVLYNTVKATTDLTTCNTYFNVPTEVVSNVFWVDLINGLDTNVGTKALPFKTLTKLKTSLIANSTGYVRSGTSTGSYFDFITTYTCNVISTGLTTLKATEGWVIRFIASNLTFKNFIIDGNGIATECLRSIGEGTNKIDKCYFKNELTYLVYNTTSTPLDLYTNCVFVGRLANAGDNLSTKSKSFDSSIFVNTYHSSTSNDVNFINCKFVNNTSKKCFDSSYSLIFKGCDFYYKLKAIETTASLTVTYCKFYPQKTLTGSITSTAGIGDFIIKNNTFVQLDSDAANGSVFIAINNVRSWDIQNNYFESKTTNAFYHCLVVNTSVQAGRTGKINYNHSLSNSLSGDSISMNLENNYSDVNDNTEVIGNYVQGSRLYLPNSATSLHAILINGGKNIIIKYNKITYANFGLVIKNGVTGTAYSSGGVFYNLISDCRNSIYVRGVKGLNIFNNTIKFSNTVYAETDISAIICDINAALNRPVENIVIKNTIIENANALGTAIFFDSYAAAHGCICEDSVIYGGQYLLQDGTNYSDLATANVAGKLLNCVVGDALLSSSLVPAVPITGVDLGDGYNTGLDTTSTFGSSTTLPVIVSKVQSATWQKGAFIQ